jgi:hypothetical protein
MVLACLTFDPEDGDSMFIRNVGKSLPYYVVSQPWRESTLYSERCENLRSHTRQGKLQEK